MAQYAYLCPNCGEFDGPTPEDSVICLTCSARAKRLRRVGVIRSSLKSQARWDPVVGQYVANEADFRSKLAEGQEAASRDLNMDVVWTPIDARDNEAAAELHGTTLAEREADLEPVRKREYDEATK